MTLTIAMMNNWITSGAGPMWRAPAGNDAYRPGDGGGGGTPLPVSNTGIGVGGQNSANGGHVYDYAISGPGWRGSTPLHPFNVPYLDAYNDVSGPNIHDQQIEVVHLAGDNDLAITINPGWWCVELPRRNPWAGEDNKLQYISGLKHWIYIDESFEVGNIPLPIGGDLYDVEIPVGLVMQAEYYHCCDNDDDPTHPCDPELADNSAGFFNPMGCGASRYVVNAIGAGTVSNANWPSQDNGTFNSAGQDEYNKLSLVCKINPFRRTVRYMNNIILFTW